MNGRACLIICAASCGTPAAPIAPHVAAPATAPTPPRDAACPAPLAGEPPTHDASAPLVAHCHHIYVDATSSLEQRDAIAHHFAASIVALDAVFGADVPIPALVWCLSDACERRYSGPSHRSHAIAKPEPTIVVNGLGPLTEGTMTHEMAHIELARRLGAATVPAWFDEGVATYLGDNAPCPANMPRGIDDLRRLSDQRGWLGYTNLPGKIEATYCQARNEVAAWATAHGRAALVGVIDAVAAGRTFDDVYGALVTAIAPADFAHDLVAAVPFDDNTGTDAIDHAGSHLTTLLGATWTTGHSGAAVQVQHGAYVRSDAYTELGVPDAPFSISLWLKPLAHGKVIIHTAKEPNGSNGWCAPLLGTDASGHLIAQVPFAARPDAYLVATGPVLALHAWSHVVLTWSGDDGARLYLGTKLVASSAPSGPAERHRFAPAAPMYLFLGSSNHSLCWAHALDAGDWNGAFGELQVYDYALGANEIPRS